jgi:hypothetical protein
MVTGSDEDEVCKTMRTKRRPEVHSDEWNDVGAFMVHFEQELLTRTDKILLKQWSHE